MVFFQKKSFFTHRKFINSVFEGFIHLNRTNKISHQTVVNCKNVQGKHQSIAWCKKITMNVILNYFYISDGFLFR